MTFCGLLSAHDGLFQACDEPAKTQVHMEDCTCDLCATGGSPETLYVVLGSSASSARDMASLCALETLGGDCSKWQLN